MNETSIQKKRIDWLNATSKETNMIFLFRVTTYACHIDKSHLSLSMSKMPLLLMLTTLIIIITTIIVTTMIIK